MPLAREVLIDSPAVFYQFGEASGDFADSSGNGLTLTAGSGVKYARPGIHAGKRRAVASAGTSAGVGQRSVPSSLTAQKQFTAETVIRVPAGNFKGTVWKIGGPSFNGFSLVIGASDGDTDGRNMLVSIDGWSWQNAGALPAGIGHHHIVVTRDSAGSTFKLYLNGSLTWTSGTISSITEPAGNISVGVSTIGSNPRPLPSTVDIDMVAMYPVEMSSGRIADHYNALGHVSYASEVLLDAPVRYYRAGEDSGSTMVDVTANAQNGTYQNSPTLGAPGALRDDGGDTAVTLNGSDEYAILPTSGLPSGSASYTLEAWFKPAALFAEPGNTTSCIMDIGTANNNNRANGLSVYSNKVRAYWWASDLDAAYTPTIGEWLHLVTTWDGTNRRIFVNGVQVASATPAAPNVLLGTPRIGWNGYVAGGANNLANGTLDEIAIYTTALSAARVATHYATGLALGPASDTEVALPLAPELGIAQEVDSIPTLAMGVATEEDVAAPIDAASLGLASETSQALPLDAELGLPSEVSSAPSLILPPTTINAGVALEVDSAPPLNPRVFAGVALESSLALGAFLGSAPLALSGEGNVAIEDEDIPIGTPEFQITILDPIIERGPGVITFTVAGGLAEQEIEFYLDGVLTWTTTLDSGGNLSPSSLGIYAGSTAEVGTHTLMGRQELLTTGDILTASTTYEVLFAPYTGPTNAGLDADPISIPGAVAHGTRHWVLQDLFPTGSGGLGSYVLPINPANTDSPHWQNSFTSRRTLAKSGQFHVFQSVQVAAEWKFSGYAPTEEMVEKLKAYRDINRRFYLIDHHNRAWKVVFTFVDLKARLRHNFNGQVSDWGHDYEVTALVLDQNWQEPVA